MSKNVLYSTLFCSLACFTCLSFAEDNSNSQTKRNDNSGPEMGPHPMRVSFRHIEGRGIGYGDGYTSLTGFFAPSPEGMTVFPFADLRGHVFDDGRFAANAGFGLRGILGDCWVLGGNAYYDFRNTKHQNFNQVSAGLEALHPRWEVRANGYLPVGRRTSGLYQETDTSTAVLNSFVGHNALIDYCLTRYGKQQYAMRGVDSEVGYHFFLSRNYDVFVAAGPYYFNFDSKNAIGGKIRAAVQIFDYLTLEVMDSYDSRFKEIFQGQISVNIPFGRRQDLSKSKTFAKCDRAYTLNQRMVQDVQRQEIIVVDRKRTTKQKCETAVALDPNTGNPINFVFVNNTSSSDGTFESPYPTLLFAQDNSGPGDVIYVYAGDGTPTGYDDGIILQDNQNLWGASTTHYLNTQFGQALIPPQSNAMPFITNFTNFNLNDFDVVSVANNNEISGFNILVSNNNGIAQENPNVTITNLNINNNVFEVNSIQNAVLAFNVAGSLNFSKNLLNLSSPDSRSESGGVVIVDYFINNANYNFMNNTMWGGFGGIQLYFYDCFNIATTISGNTLNTGDGWDEAIIINVCNTTSVSPNSFVIENNRMFSQGENIFVTTDGFSNTSFSVSSNHMYAVENSNIVFDITSSSNVSVNISSNEISAAEFISDNLDVYMQSGTSANFTITGNNMSSRNDNIYFCVAGKELNLLVENNNFIAAYDANIYIEQFDILNTNASINSNTFSSLFSDNVDIYAFNYTIANYQIDGNTFNGSGDTGGGYEGLYMETNSSAYMTANITNNAVQLGFDNGIVLRTFSSSHGNWNVSGNAITGYLGNDDGGPFRYAVAVAAHNASSTCLLFTDNTANPQIAPFFNNAAFLFDNDNGPSSTFSLQPLSGNLGYIQETGIITNVPLDGCP